MVGKDSQIPDGITIEPGGIIATNVLAEDFTTDLITSDMLIETKKLPYEI
jgi:hypothetical protein